MPIACSQQHCVKIIPNHAASLTMLKSITTTLICFTQLAFAFTWPENTAENVNLNQQHIDAAIEQIEAGEVGNIRSLIIVKDGQLITEKYFGNLGEKRPVYSVTKSVGSALLGIAKYKGANINTSDSIMSYFPQYNNISNYQQAQNITLHDLLTQRHGYNWDEWSTSFSNLTNPVNKMLRSGDWYKFTLQWPINQAPDQNFTYSTGHSSLMSPVLKHITNRDVYEFANTELFQPLGITDTHWELIDGGGSQGQGITQFPFGLEPLGFGLWLKPIDMAKFGELYRLSGVWQGSRLLDESWVDLSTQPYSNGMTDPDVFPDEFSGYGYQWWTVRLFDELGRGFDMYYADGYGRQYIFVLPDFNAVIVTTADDFFYDGPGIGTVLSSNLLLAFEFDDNLSIPITTDLNGSWYWPENSGQGINIEILNNGTQLWGYWYTYSPVNGSQRWFTLQGTIDGNQAEFDIISTSNGGFVVSEPPELTLWGTGTVFFESCLNGTFNFTSEVEASSGTIPLTRLTASTGSCLPNNKLITNKPYNLK